MSSPKSNAEQNIGVMRSKIEKLKTERRATEIAPRSRSESLALIDQHVEVMGQANGVSVERFRAPTFRPGTLSVCSFNSIESALCRIAPEMMAKFFHSELSAHLEGQPPGVSDATRAKTIERLDREIRELEVQEELAVCGMEASGAEVDRRADLDPEVFLEVEIEDEAA